MTATNEIVARRLLKQAKWCQRLGSHLYSTLLRQAAGCPYRRCVLGGFARPSRRSTRLSACSAFSRGSAPHRAAAPSTATCCLLSLGGGTVEGYPEDATGRSVSASFLHNGTVSMFEREGFERSRRLGKNHWVVTKVVRKSSRKRPPAQR
jgi:hypothetical protein